MSKKVLVAYFSASGATRRAAKDLAQAVDGYLFEIKPAVPYTKEDLNWNDKKSRSSVEMNDPNSRPELASFDLDITEYDEILIGFPVWWYVAPTIINSFIESFDLSGKDVALFATSGGSGIDNCERNLKKQYPSINWKPGRLLNSKTAVDNFARSI